MTMRTYLSLAAVVVALCGCGPSKPASTDHASAGSGSGLLHDIQAEMMGSSKATRQGVALDVYFDVSDSSTALKKPLGKLLEQVADTYPEAVPYTYSFYGKACNLQDSGVANMTSLRRAAKAWSASSLRDKTTNLGEAFRRIRERAESDPKTDYAAVIVSDGGFEDPDVARGELRKLRACENVRLLAFVGVHTGDNPKLQRLSELTEATASGKEGMEIQLVTDANNSASIEATRSSLKHLVESAKKVD